MDKEKKTIKLEYKIKYESIKRLVMAAFLLGQETGLKGMTYEHPLAKQYRNNLVDLIINPVLGEDYGEKKEN